MICKFCGDEFAGRPIKQGSQLFCSIGCANLAEEMSAEEEDEYYDEHELEMDVTENEEEIY